RMEGTTYGDVPLNAELKLEVWDSPNSAGVITDALRCLKLGLDRGLKGTLVAPSSYFMKSPPVQIHDDVAHQRVEAFIRGEDNETLVGTENLTKAQLKKLASTAPARSTAARKPAAAAREAGDDGQGARRAPSAQGARASRSREARRRGVRGCGLGRRPRPAATR